MLSINLINQSFLEKEEKVYLENLQKLFKFFANLKKWKNLKGEINLVLIDNAEIQKLNKNYRNKNIPTDVLSFPYLEIEEILKNKEPTLTFGEIFIAKERAKADAKELDITFQQELNKIFVHGILHLLGYDHIYNEDYLDMKKEEDYILKAFAEEIFDE